MDLRLAFSEKYKKAEPPVVAVGDTVRVMETRPMSKMKRWRLIEGVERAK